MTDGPAVDFSVGQENRGWGPVDPASRCGFPLGGKRQPNRCAGSSPQLPVRLAAGILIEATWSQDVSWRKRIRISKP
jgi:hypothetical protein